MDEMHRCLRDGIVAAEGAMVLIESFSEIEGLNYTGHVNYCRLKEWVHAARDYRDRLSAERDARSREENWSPLLKTDGLQISLYGWGGEQGDTIEFRDGQQIYVHLSAKQTADLLLWLDSRDVGTPELGSNPKPNAKLTAPEVELNA